MASFKELARKFELKSGNRYAFPEVGWEITDPKLFDRYRIASKITYDPYKDLPWDQLRADEYSEEEKIALRYYWSRHAIFEYILVVTLTKTLEETIIQGYPTEMKQLLIAHFRDEWHHTEMAAEYARRLGGVLLTPALLRKYGEHYAQRSEDLRKRIFPTFMRISFAEMVEGLAWYGPFRQLSDPIARKIFSFIYVDEFRHARSNWEWSTKGLDSGTGKVTDEDRTEANRLFSNLLTSAAYDWLGFGYLKLPTEEREFHTHSIMIAKELGHSLYDAEEFLSAYTKETKNLSKILSQAGISVRV